MHMFHLEILVLHSIFHYFRQEQYHHQLYNKYSLQQNILQDNLVVYFFLKMSHYNIHSSFLLQHHQILQNIRKVHR